MLPTTTVPGPLRPCGGCDVVDDGPRHVTGLANAPEGAAPLPDWHPACHAAAGCRTCIATTTQED